MKSFSKYAVLAPTAVAAVAILAALLASPLAANANTITTDTFDFAQTGYINPSTLNKTILLEGSFTGVVSSNGFIAAPTSFFSSYLDDSAGIFSIGTSPSFFSYNLAGGASSLDFIVFGGDGNTLCVGAAAGFSPQCAAGMVAGVVNGFFTGNLSHTADLPTVTLVSSVVTGGGSGVTPEPASLWLLATGLGAFWAIAFGRRRMNRLAA